MICEGIEGRYPQLFLMQCVRQSLDGGNADPHARKGARSHHAAERVHRRGRAPRLLQNLLDGRHQAHGMLHPAVGFKYAIVPPLRMQQHRKVRGGSIDRQVIHSEISLSVSEILRMVTRRA